MVGKKIVSQRGKELLVPVWISDEVKAFFPLGEVEDRRLIDIKPKDVVKKGNETVQISRKLYDFRSRAHESPYFITPSSPIEIHIIKQLNDQGLIAGGLVEHPVMKSSNKPNERMYLMQNLGKGLREVKVPLERREKIANQLSRYVGVMHSLGISHNDLNQENILLTSNDDVAVIDFRKSKKTKVLWDDDDKIVRAFSKDLGYLYDTIDSKFYDISKTPEDCIRDVVSYYPIGEERKNGLLKKIIKEITN